VTVSSVQINESSPTLHIPFRYVQSVSCDTICKRFVLIGFHDYGLIPSKTSEKEAWWRGNMDA
jgi:hypothetical protein